MKNIKMKDVNESQKLNKEVFYHLCEMIRAYDDVEAGYDVHKAEERFKNALKWIKTNSVVPLDIEEIIEIWEV